MVPNLVTGEADDLGGRGSSQIPLVIPGRTPEGGPRGPPYAIQRVGTACAGRHKRANLRCWWKSLPSVGNASLRRGPLLWRSSFQHPRPFGTWPWGRSSKTGRYPEWQEPVFQGVAGQSPLGDPRLAERGGPLHETARELLYPRTRIRDDPHGFVEPTA